ncbi:inositol monophosphatase family protein [Novosphingobium sp. TCA1]|uniref:inositol monophosphatase family protein n=1 Tax=Novosphingobium sp. TCA1 TaxID=2682474 RepID=UPI001307AE36|nr:inositol monophosphatase family protein [Novosphingobium sp. TCA1]GFE76172.1 inositol phosphatase [Novosphingobium sp. TCA1]
MNQSLTPAVERAMRDAARIAIMPRFGTAAARAIADKAQAPGDCEPVTAADRECEEILSERLAALIPGAKVIGEEAVHHDPELLDGLRCGTCWIIDPLDGTANFAAGTGPFGVLVALAEDGIPVGGWILDPLSGRFCAALAGRGAFLNGETWQARASGRDRPLVAVTRLMPDPDRGRLLAALAEQAEVLDSPRCAADQYPRIASGENDVTLFTRTLPWDHAAGIVFLNEAGGRAARPDGTVYRCDDAREGLIAATTSQDWERMASRLAALGETLSRR